MHIAGIQKSTLVDYPGHVSCVIFTQGCNFRCPFCHNPECVLPEKMKLFQNDLIPEEVFFNFLESRKGFLDGVSICGGEPTLQPDLYEIAKKIKNMGFKVKLDTNGRDYKIVKRMIQDGILDYVAIDLKHAFYNYDIAVGIHQPPEFYLSYQKLLQILLEGNIDYEYRTTVIKGMHTVDDIESMTHFIRGAKNYYLQNYIGGNTLDPNFGGTPFSEEELEEFKIIAEKYVQHVGIRS
ncbi:MAG: anaerobic ribonucleoside-triphosphate reductase activating protein [Candidatus Absconditabacteria bacterium]|nr:anaerobic ribonucleoside-triphosphate reductase activating protein [Candidatus Absconditabacteria bacterium]